MFKAGAQLFRCAAKYLPFPPNCRIVGASKTSAAAARAVESSWPDPLSGLIVVVRSLWSGSGGHAHLRRHDIVNRPRAPPPIGGLGRCYANKNK
jgi:hypothetical protein